MWLRRGCPGAALALAALLVQSLCANAVGDRVKTACKADYYQHCSQFSVGTEELRQCMRKVGEGLSAPCLVALVEEGEITKADVEKAKISTSQNAKKTHEASSATTKPDAALGDKGGKKKKSKATQSVGADKHKNGAATKKETAVKNAKAAKNGATKKGKVAKTKKTGGDVQSVEKKKGPKASGSAKKTTAKAGKHAGKGLSKIESKGKAKKVGKVRKPAGVATSAKTKKSAKHRVEKKEGH